MKTLSKFGIVAAMAGSLFLASCATEGYVVEQPVEPVYTRPVAPYANAYWVPGEWVYNGNRYVYRNGYYTRARANRVYVQGSWARSQRGYVWHRGHWRR
nr:YXWGXW repeat-containing protein [Mucilaginibacter sp. L294]